MRVKALKTFASVSLGNVGQGDVREVKDSQARQLIAHGFVEEYETKVIVHRPNLPTGEQSASQVGQASEQTTSDSQASADGSASQSTQASGSDATSYTPLTDSGGTSTPERLPHAVQHKGGRKAGRATGKRQ